MHSLEKIQQSIDTILLELEKRQLSAYTIDDYRFHYRELTSYIIEKNITKINEVTLLDFLKIRFDIDVPDFYVKGLASSVNRRLRPLALLCSYIITSKFNPLSRLGKIPFMCPDGFLESYKGFLEYLQQKELSPPTVRTNRKITERLIHYLINEGIELSDQLTAKHINSFFSQFQGNSVKYNGTILYVLRNYLTYLWQEGFLEINLSESLPHLRIPKHGGIPHAWSKEELRAILDV